MKRADNRVANASFVCALLVLFIHLEQVPQTVGSVSWAIYYVIRYVLAVAAVPFFFTVSGYFLAGRIGTFGGWRRSVYMVHPVLVRSMNAAGMFPNVSWAYVIEWCGAAGASLGLVGLLRRFAPRTTGWAFGGR